MEQVNFKNQKEEHQISEKEKKLQEKTWSFFAPAAFLYAFLYTFCLYKNASGLTYPFFVAGGLWFFVLCLRRLGISLKKGSVFYLTVMMLLGISTFCTDDGKIIFLNRAANLLLLLTFLLYQFFDISKWKLGQFLKNLCQTMWGALTGLGRLGTAGAIYRKEKEEKGEQKYGYVLLGVAMALPLLMIVGFLLASADALFRQIIEQFFAQIDFASVVHVLWMLFVGVAGSYGLLSFLCKGRIRESAEDHRKGEPVFAITVLGMLTLLYLVFSGIQILGLFLGKLSLPEGYTYASYAREGFFQLLAIAILNLILVLACLEYFRESKILKGILTVMSICTFIMILSSAMRMILYIRTYQFTFLRILVLWALFVLFLLFLGIVWNIFRPTFGLLRYSFLVMTLCYLCLSFSHTDYWIAKANLATMGTEADYTYLWSLSADAAPVLVPAAKEQMDELTGNYYLRRLEQRLDRNSSIRGFNLSRYMAEKILQGR